MIALFKAGDTHEVRGIKCEVIRCSFNDMEEKIKEGYVKDPSELYATEEVTKVIEPVVEVEKKIDPVRQAAKDAGIEGWDIKRINTLKALLDDNKD